MLQCKNRGFLGNSAFGGWLSLPRVGRGWVFLDMGDSKTPFLSRFRTWGVGYFGRRSGKWCYFGAFLRVEGAPLGPLFVHFRRFLVFLVFFACFYVVHTKFLQLLCGRPITNLVAMIITIQGIGEATLRCTHTTETKEWSLP